MRRKKLALSTSVAFFLVAMGTLGLASPATAANTAPSDLYFPNTGANGSTCNTAPSQVFVDGSSNPIAQYPGLTGANGYTVTIHNLCPGTIYIYHGQASPYTALASGATATYTLTGNAASVQALTQDSFSGSTLASIGVSAPPDVTTTGTNASTSLSTSSISTAVNGNFVIQNDGSNTINISGNSGGVRFGGQTCTLGAPCTVSASSNRSFTVISQGTVRVGSATLTIGSGGGGGSSSSSDAAPLETLSLAAAANGASCTGGNPTGYSGSWLTLPSADQCTQTGPTAKAGTRLLGWATSASFPIARAQAQIDKKWGVIDEEIDGVRMIFIPAGMATFVSGSNNLFPIWSA